MGTVNSDTIKGLYKVLKADFLKAFGNGEPVNTPDFVMETTSTSASETYGWLGQVPQMQKWVDERKIRGLSENKYEIFNEDYEATLGVKRNDIEDDKLGAIKIRIADLARRAATHPWKLIIDAVMAGSTALCYDGQAFFSASHVEGNNQTAQSNIVSRTGNTVALTKADFLSAVAKLQSFKDDQGEPYNEGELKLTVLAHPAQRGVMEELFKAAVISQTTNVLVGAANVIYSSRLTSTTNWYLFETGSSMKPFIKQIRKPVEFNALENESDQGFMRKVFAYGVDYRIGIGYGLWQKAIYVYA